MPKYIFTMIEVKNLYKSYNNKKVLSDINFNLNDGEILGIIGADGSGKSTLLKILSTLVLPDTTKTKIYGYDLVKDYQQIRKIIAYMSPCFSLYGDLSIDENIDFFAKIHSCNWKENLQEILPIYQQLQQVKNRKASALSGGMKQKLALCCALIHKPKLLILDEPTTGVDPCSRKDFWDILLSLNKSIIITSSYMDEIARSDKIAFIQNGKFIRLDKPKTLCENIQSEIYALEGIKIKNIMTILKNDDNVKNFYAFKENIHIVFKEHTNTSKWLSIIEKKCNQKLSLYKTNANLEDCFMELNHG
ncbi:ABC transporter ATP-binding protein [Campylobacter lari]|nr:ABC transporter ATP-binding protein [Campylobacter lari]